MKTKSIISKIASFTLAFVMVFSLMACSGGSSGNEAEKAVNNFFKALKKGDIKTSSSYLVDGEGDLGDESQEAILKSLFKNLEYKVLSSEVKDDTAVVKTKITTTDLSVVFTDILGEVMTKALEMAAEGEESSEEEIQKLFEELIDEKMKDPDVEKVTNEVEINLVKEDDKWLIESDDDFINAITGNLMNAMEGLGGF